MGEKELLERISADPNILHGKPCIKGTRIPVYLILDNLSEGVSHEEILEQWPSLQPEDIQAALVYAAELARRRTVAV